MWKVVQCWREIPEIEKKKKQKKINIFLCTSQGRQKATTPKELKEDQVIRGIFQRQVSEFRQGIMPYP